MFSFLPVVRFFSSSPFDRSSAFAAVNGSCFPLSVSALILDEDPFRISMLTVAFRGRRQPADGEIERGQTTKGGMQWLWLQLQAMFAMKDENDAGCGSRRPLDGWMVQIGVWNPSLEKMESGKNKTKLKTQLKQEIDGASMIKQSTHGALIYGAHASGRLCILSFLVLFWDNAFDVHRITVHLIILFAPPIFLSYCFGEQRINNPWWRKEIRRPSFLQFPNIGTRIFLQFPEIGTHMRYSTLVKRYHHFGWRQQRSWAPSQWPVFHQSLAWPVFLRFLGHF